MSSQEPESSSDYGWRESEGDAKPRFSLRKMVITLIVMAIILGSPWWVTAIPQFNFTQ